MLTINLVVKDQYYILTEPCQGARGYVPQVHGLKGASKIFFKKIY